MDKPKKIISIIVPAYNEADNLQILHQEISRVFEKLHHDFELIFVNDGSSDHSAQIIEKISQQDKRVKYIEFSRNFGKEVSTTAGMHHATGDAVMMVDADLQHPVEMIPEFIKRWENGNEIVIGVRTKREENGVIKKLGSVVFNYLMHYLTDANLLHNTTDFRLVDRVVVNEFNKLNETNRITRGLIDWLGFRKDFVEFHAKARLNGHAKYNFVKLLKLAVNTFVNHSLFPLRLAGYLGLLIILISGPAGLFILIEKYILNDPWGMNITGSATLGVLILFLVGIILGCLGLIALYIANIHMEVNDRPLYIVRRKINI